MSWLPKSPKARRRLTLVLAIAPVLALALGLTLWGLRGSISFFYTPSQAVAARPPAGRSIQLGGMVRMGSVAKYPDGRVDFVVNTPFGRGARSDGYEIRRAALEKGVPCITTLAGASAAVSAIEAARRPRVTVHCLQDLHSDGED